MQSSLPDKVLAPLCDRPAFLYSVEAFIEAGCVDRITVVYRDVKQRRQLEDALGSLKKGILCIDWAQGGTERQHSVANALTAQPKDCQFVFIHDCARPLIQPDALRILDRAVRRDGAAVLAHRVVDTIKRAPDPERLQSTELEDLDRSRLWAMETPQAFEFAAIRAAYDTVAQKNLSITDDAAAAASIGHKITLVPNPHPNPKLTCPADLAYIEYLIRQATRIEQAND